MDFYKVVPAPASKHLLTRRQVIAAAGAALAGCSKSATIHRPARVSIHRFGSYSQTLYDGMRRVLALHEVDVAGNSDYRVGHGATCYTGSNSENNIKKSDPNDRFSYLRRNSGYERQATYWFAETYEARSRPRALDSALRVDTHVFYEISDRSGISRP